MKHWKVRQIITSNVGPVAPMNTAKEACLACDTNNGWGKACWKHTQKEGSNDGT